MVPNAKISVISRKPKERYDYGAQRQNLSYIKKTKGALGLWCPTPKYQLYSEILALGTITLTLLWFS
jgi:hypothetical protein